MDRLLLTLFVFMAFAAIERVIAITEVGNIVPTVTCYECNVWKAGYGNLCDSPRIRSGCLFCMKTETTIFMGYYKNTPRTSTITSRICGKTKNVAFGHECLYYRMSDGHSKRCYCDTDLCNAASRPASTSILLPALAVAMATVIRNLYL